MSNALTIIRSLIIYSLCLPLAIFLGYLLAMPMDAGSFTIVVLALGLPLLPLLLKHHHLLLFACWNTSMVIFFLPGRPSLGMVMILISFLLSILQHILNRNIRFLHVPAVSRPLIFLALVVVGTAMLTGGFGSRLMGGEVYGGKRYFLILAAIIGYFALCCFPVPKGKANLYVALYLLGTGTAVIGNLAPYVPRELYFLFALFPVESLSFLEGGPTQQRLGGLTTTGLAVVCYILARHGMRGLLDLGDTWRLFPFRFRGGFGFNNPWRLVFFFVMLWVALLGGYRSTAIVFGLLFAIQFYLEGLCRTHLLPTLLLVGILAAAIGLPMIDRMPLMIQRSVSFIPFLEVDPVARQDAQYSSEWRLQMWKIVLPTVPQYLLLGKGYSIDSGELNMSVDTARSTVNAAQSAILAGDYHNGPLSLIIPLGIFGVIGFVWFLFAGFRVLLNNFRHGDPELYQVNAFLLAYFTGRVIFYFVVFGAFYVELMIFTGLVGLSVSINGGVRQPVTAPVEKPAFDQFKLARAVR